MKKKILIIGLVLLAAAAMAVFFFRKKSVFTVATYGLSKKEEAAVETFCESLLEKDEKITFVRLDTAKPLSKEIQAHKETVLVFAENGLSLENAKSFFKPFPKEDFSALPSVFSNQGAWIALAYPETSAETQMPNAKNAFLYSYPLNTDIFEINLKKSFYKDAVYDQILTSGKIAAFLASAKSTTAYPLCFAGADDETLSFLISSLLTELSPDYTNDEFSALQHTIDFHRYLPHELKTVLNLLLDWEHERYMHPQWYDLVDSDVENFIEFDQSTVAMMKVSDHSRSDRNFLSDFAARKMLFSGVLARMNLPARTISVSIVDRHLNKKDEELLARLIEAAKGADAQSKIADEIGFTSTAYDANTSSALSTAADWVYAANSLLPTTDKILFQTAPEQKAFLQEIRTYLKSGGQGYK